MFSIIISTVPLHLAWRCKSGMLLNYQPNGRAERHPEFQPVISLTEGWGLGKEVYKYIEEINFLFYSAGINYNVSGQIRA